MFSPRRIEPHQNSDTSDVELVTQTIDIAQNYAAEGRTRALENRMPKNLQHDSRSITAHLINECFNQIIIWLKNVLNQCFYKIERAVTIEQKTKVLQISQIVRGNGTSILNFQSISYSFHL